VLVAASILNNGSQFFRTGPSHSRPSLVNTDPRCHGVQLLPDRSFQRIVVYRWRNAGTGFVTEPTGLDGSMAIDAGFNPLPAQPDDHNVIVNFNPEGQVLLDQITAEIAVHHDAGPFKETPANHLPVLVGLSDQQIANWADPEVARKALIPVEEGGNLLSNGLVVEPFRGNRLIVYTGADLPSSGVQPRPVGFV
jgi:hypothetical protein